MLARGFLCRSFLQTFDDDDSGATGYQNNSSISVCVSKIDTACMYACIWYIYIYIYMHDMCMHA